MVIDFENKMYKYQVIDSWTDEKSWVFIKVTKVAGKRINSEQLYPKARSPHMEPSYSLHKFMSELKRKIVLPSNEYDLKQFLVKQKFRELNAQQ